MEPLVSVIIPAFNEEMYIGQCIQALKDQEYPTDRYEIIVIDNGSSDRTVTISIDLGVRIEVLADGNVGAVRNLGATVAAGDILAFIDADCLAEKDWIKTGINLVQKKQNSIFGGGCKLHPDANWVEQSWLLGDLSQITPKELIGACIFIKKDIFLKSGGFDETITSGEDSELSLRLKKFGYDVVMSPTLNVIHLGNAKTLIEFFKRQLWHSENYIFKLSESIKDPTFILITIFTALSIIFIFSLLISTSTSMIFGAALLAIPGIFSAKRIRRSKYQTKKIIDIFKIYILDVTYVLGRSCGLLKGLANRNLKSSVS